MPFRRITIFAAAGAYNLGDEAIVLAEVSFLRERYPNARISISTYDAKSTLIPDEWGIRYFSYFPNGFRRRPWANAGFFLRTVWEIFRSDLIVVGGGGIFYDNEGQSFGKQVFEWRFRTATARFFRKPVLFFGVGIDVSDENAEGLKPIFRDAAVTVRDEKSAATLSRIGVSSKVVPDPAFLVPPIREDIENVRGRPIMDSIPKIGISIRKGYLNGGDESVCRIIETVRKFGFDPFFLNHSFHPDNSETDDFQYAESFARKYGLWSTRSIGDSYWAYRNVAAVIAMRLHAGVLSFVNAVPCFVLSYSKKTDAFVRRAEIRDAMPASEFDAEEFEKRFSRFVLESVSLPIFANAEKCAKIREEARNSYEEIFYGLERH